MLQKQQAFAPGHISGFFEPVIDKENINRTGSRGSGLSISSGATSTVKIKPSTSQKIITRINQTPTRMPVTILAVKKLVANQRASPLSPLSLPYLDIGELLLEKGRCSLCPYLFVKNGGKRGGW